MTRGRLRSVWLYGVALATFALLAGPRLVARPPNEFIAQAEAWLAGRLDIAAPLASYLDLAEFGGRYFVPYPPAPALLYTPLVAMWGRGVYQGVAHALLAAALLPLFERVLHSYGHGDHRSARERLWLALLLVFGTPIAALGAASNVYFTGQIVAVLFTCLYLLAAAGARRPTWAGVALGAAFMARGATLLGFPVFLAELMRTRSRGERWPELARFAVGLGCVLAVAAWYNWARFGQPTEFGYRYLDWRIDPTLVRWGLFNWVYVERNLHAALTSLPVLLPVFPYVAFHPEGMSLLLTTPVLLLLPTLRHWSNTARAALLSAGLIFLPALFYANTGFAQYGYRYAADFLPYLVLSMALAGLRVQSRGVKGIILLGVVVSLWGAWLAGWHPFSAALGQWIDARSLLQYRP